MTMGCRFAASPINWCNDDMNDLGDEYDVTDILADMRRLGFRGTEMGRKYPQMPDALKSLLQHYNLQFVSRFVVLHGARTEDADQSLKRLREHVQFLVQMGASIVVAIEGTGSVHWDITGDRKDVVPWSDTEWARVVTHLQRAGEVCREHGLYLSYHPHLGTNVETPEAIRRVLDNTHKDLVFLTLDTGHIYAGGGDSAALVNDFGKRVRHVHLKDVRSAVLKRYREESIGFLQAVREGIFTVPGDGVIDFGPIIDALRQKQYEGWCVVEAEQDPQVAEPVQYMQRALAYLANLGVEIGG